MKKILLVLILVNLGIIANSQFPLQQNLGSKNTQVNALGGMAADSGFVFRYCFADTFVANRGYIKNIPRLTRRNKI